MALEKQFSVRLSDEQRTYLKEQVWALKKNDLTRMSSWSEGDVLRGLIALALKNDFDFSQSVVQGIQ